MVRYTGFVGMARDTKNSNLLALLTYMTEKGKPAPISELDKQLAKYRTLSKSSVSAALAMAYKNQTLPVLVKRKPHGKRYGTKWTINPALKGTHSKIVAKLLKKSFKIEKGFEDPQIRPALEALAKKDKSIKLPESEVIDQIPKMETEELKDHEFIKDAKASDMPSLDEVVTAFKDMVDDFLSEYKISVNINFEKRT